MTRRAHPLFAIAIGVGITLLAALAFPAFAQPGSDAPRPPDKDASPLPTVEIQLASGEAPKRGTLKLSAITLITNSGSTTINIPHIKRITLQRDPDGSSHDTVRLTDKSIQSGRVSAEEFEFTPEEGERTILKKAEIREIRVISQVPVALTAILLGLLTLTAMEIILGVDNVIFLAIIAAKLPKEQQPKARKIGLAAALGTRLLLLFSLSFLLGLTAPVFTLPDIGLFRDMEAREVSWRDIILLCGGLFLIGKSVIEMHEKLEHARSEKAGGVTGSAVKGAVSFANVIFTIAVIDIVFSLDSVITAVGMVEELWVMVVAMVLAMMVMLYFATPIAHFVDRHPTVKVLALSFLILIGVMLVAEGLGQHIDKGYIYAAMTFAVLVEMINLQLRKPAHTAVKETPAV